MKLIILSLSLLIFSSLADESIPDEKADKSRYQVVTTNIKNRQPDDYIGYNEDDRARITQEYQNIYDLEGILNAGYNRQQSGYEENNNRGYNRQQYRFGENIDNRDYNRQQLRYEENNNRGYNRQQYRYGENKDNRGYNRQQLGYEENDNNQGYNRQQYLYGENIDNSAYNQQSGYEDVNLLHNMNPHNGQYDRQYNIRYRPEGREGLGFDKRTAFALGLRYPLTPQLLYTIRRYPNEKP